MSISSERRAPGTMTGRDAFMSNIASRLGRRTPSQTPPERPFKGAPEFYTQRRMTQEEHIEQFMANWMALSGKVLVVSEAEAPAAVAAYIRQICEEHGITRITRWEHEALIALGFDGPVREAGIEIVPWREDGADGIEPGPSPSGEGGVWQQRERLLRATETCRLGIVWPDYAVSSTSSLALFSHGGKGRSVSLLTDALLAVFRADQLVFRIGEAFEQFKRRYPDAVDMPASLNLITGPSRSADIENDLTIGIHGPGKVHAVIIR